MKKFFKKVFYVILVTLIYFSSMPLLASDVGLTVGLEYAGKSMWRGISIYEKEGAFFPSISYDVFDTGLSIGIVGEIVDEYVLDLKATRELRDLNYTDFFVDYSNKFGLVTLGVGAVYYRAWNNDYSYSTGTISLTFEDIFLSPTLIYNHDYYFDSNLDNQAKDFYIQFGISHSFDLIQDAVSLDLGAIAGYYSSSLDNDNKTSGISDIDLSVGLTVANGIVEYFAGFHYIIVPSKDYYYSLDFYGGGLKKDRSRFYSAFGVSCSF